MVRQLQVAKDKKESSIELDDKADYVATCQAADKLFHGSTKDAHYELMLTNGHTVPSPICRNMNVDKAVAELKLWLANGSTMQRALAWVGMTKIWVVDNEQLKPWDHKNAEMRQLQPDSSEADAEDFISKFQACYLNDVTNMLCKHDSRAAIDPVRVLACAYMDTYNAEFASKCSKFKRQAQPCVLAGIEDITRTVCGFICCISPRPLDRGSNFTHVDFLLPQQAIESEIGKRHAKVDPAVRSLRMLGNAGRIMQTNLAQSKLFRQLRVDALASQAVDQEIGQRMNDVEHVLVSSYADSDVDAKDRVLADALMLITAGLQPPKQVRQGGVD